ncbi:MAG: hypothetical protein ACOYXC_18985 [Candidatus Rifleibacteriota bacterium]
MKKFRFLFIVLILFAATLSTGCDASKIMETISKVAEAVQKAAPAIKQVVDTISQTVNNNGSADNNQNVNQTQNDTKPVEQTKSNGQASVNVSTPRDQEDLSPAPAASGSSNSANIPSRSSSAETGSSFMARTANMSRTQKDQAIVQAITSGNMPSFLRQFRDVTVTKTINGRSHTITYKVMPDYLAIGSDSDFVRVPMTPAAAQRIAEAFGCILPTTKMVDDIYRNASTRLNPQTMPPTGQMTSNQYFVEHSRMIETQRRNSGHTQGQLLAGHKKDVVISNRLNNNPNKVAIYGWHRSNGNPIQPLSTVHSEDYADYSHGIRLIQKRVVVDGREMDIEDVLRDPTLCQLLSNEGPISNTSAVR